MSRSLHCGWRRFRPDGVIAAAAIACAAVTSATVSPALAFTTAAPNMRSFDIPSTDLGAALQTYGRLTQSQLLFSPDLVRGRQSRTVKGSYSGDEALRRLLAGSGLGFKRTSANVILITPPDAPPAKTKAQAAPVRSAPPGAGPVAMAPGEVETVVVIVGKRPENLQDVPSSVLAATSAALERNAVRDFDDIVRVAPSMTITKTSQPGNNSVNIRGIGTYAFTIATEPSVAVIVDDVPRPFQAAAFSALVDVQQVEVMRGPQNTLFGKSASAGVIHITTRPPSDTFTARADAFVTSDDERRFQATVSGPLNDLLKFRLTGHHSAYRGNLYNLTTGTWLNGTADTTLRGKLEWTPGDDWTVTLSGFSTRTDSTCCASAVTFVSPGVTFTKANLPQDQAVGGITIGPDNRVARMDVDARARARDHGASLRIVRRLGGHSLMSITAVNQYRLNDLQDTDTTDFDFSTLAPQAPKGGSANGGFFNIRSTTQEIRLTSPDNGRLRYVAGLWYSDTRSQRYFVRGSNSLGTYNGLMSLPSSNLTNYAAYSAWAQAANYAVFGQATYDLTERWSLVGGLRTNVEDILYSYHDLGNGITYGVPGCATTSPTLAVETCHSDTAVTGRASVVYRFSPDIMGFATVSRGHKGWAYDLTSTLTTRSLIGSGPFKGLPVADVVAARQPVAPERADNYELGFKSSLFDRHLTWNVTAFHERFTGFQAQSRDVATGQNVLNSIGRVSTTGIETELSARFGPWSVNGSGAYNYAVMDYFPNATCFGLQTVAEGCVGGMQDLSGKPLPNAPQWNVNGTVTYEKALRGDWTGFVTVGGRWQSQVVFNLLQDPDSVQKAYGVVNLSAGVGDGRWKATVFVNNVFDQDFALTKARETYWNISRTAVPATNATNWKPARDSARYVGVRVSASY